MSPTFNPSLTLYGLRHTVAVILRESGADERTIADALGQKTIEMARHYARGADLRRKMRGVVASFDREVRRKIRRATDAQYEFRSDDLPEALARAWPLYQRCAERKPAVEVVEPLAKAEPEADRCDEVDHRVGGVGEREQRGRRGPGARGESG